MTTPSIIYRDQVAVLWKALRRPLLDYIIIAVVLCFIFDPNFLSGLPQLLSRPLFVLCTAYCGFILLRKRSVHRHSPS